MHCFPEEQNSHRKMEIIYHSSGCMKQRPSHLNEIGVVCLELSFTVAVNGRLYDTKAVYKSLV
jgi:hypothetical protein